MLGWSVLDSYEDIDRLLLCCSSAAGFHQSADYKVGDLELGMGAGPGPGIGDLGPRTRT